MKVIQLMPTVSEGDAVSNDALEIKKIISGMGLQTEIYAERTGKNLPKNTARQVSSLKNIRKDDVIIYHMSTGTDLNFSLDRYKCRKIMIYHNITPPDFFREYSHEAFARASYGYEGLDFLRNRVDYCLADSEYNKSELLKRGFECPVDVCPVIADFAKYRRNPDGKVMKKYRDGKKNIIFVGRIAPNKKHENIIKTFYFYKKTNPDSRLVFVGSYGGFENYFRRLKNYVDILGLDDVVFTGHVSFPEILAYYRTADLFLCMSEHEGFCVPLAESMFFNIPIIALDRGAVGETLGNSGIILRENDPILTAGIVGYTLDNGVFRREIISGQRKRLADFSYKKTSGIFKKQLEKFIDGRYKS